MAENRKGIGPRGLGSPIKQKNPFKEFGEKVHSDFESGQYDISPRTGYVVKERRPVTSSDGTRVGDTGEYGERQYFGKYSEPSAEDTTGGVGTTLNRKYVMRHGEETLAEPGITGYYDKKVYLDDYPSERAIGGSLSDKVNRSTGSIVSDYLNYQKRTGRPSISVETGGLLDYADPVARVRYGSGSGGGENYTTSPQYKELMSKIDKKSDTKRSYGVTGGGGGFISATDPSTGQVKDYPVDFRPNAEKIFVRPETLFRGTQKMYDRFAGFTGGTSRPKFDYPASETRWAQAEYGSKPGQILYGPARGAGSILEERGTQQGLSGFSDYLTERMNVLAARAADTKRKDLY